MGKVGQEKPQGVGVWNTRFWLLLLFSATDKFGDIGKLLPLTHHLSGDQNGLGSKALSSTLFLDLVS